MSMRIAFFGQAAFGRDALVRLLEEGHGIAGVYAPPDTGRPDPLAAEAEERGLTLHRHKFFRRRGEAIPERVEEHTRLGADLNVLAFVTAILPPEIVDGPTHGSLCFHPSLLPRFRGGSALAWQIIHGERESGVTIFRPDDGVDTGPVVVQRGGVEIGDTDTAGSLYFNHLFAMGVEAMVDAVNAVDDGTAEYVAQDETRATHQGLVGEDESRIDWSRSAVDIDRLMRGCDPQPGAHALLDGEVVRFFGAHRIDTPSSEAPGTILGIEDGELRIAADGVVLAVGRVRIGSGRKIPAADSGLERGARFGQLSP